MILRFGLVAVVVAGAMLFAFAIPQSSVTTLENRTSHASMRLAVDEDEKSFAFVDQRGQPFTLDRLHGKAVILAFMCTRCRDAERCEGISGRFAYLQRHLPRGIHLVQITFDPKHDTSDVLAAYGRRFGADAERWTLATGSDLASAAGSAAAFGIAEPTPKTFGRPANPSHVGQITLLDPNGRIADVLDDGEVLDPATLLTEARVVAGLSTNPAVRLELARRRLSALPPRNQRVDGLLIFAGPAALFLIGLLTRALLVAFWRRRSRYRRTAISYEAVRRLRCESG